ncbi:nuclear RNA export factor 1 isoform X2 [Pantherophis guttatus]|uniref:Nuclear RNA export factor 1 isoform X2 n=1 Tax=Pantherophis guttatus TaxID=94885 RepID=A0A6P9CD29_PANGU|nr:nuclear RNA export factor 1 isoform X2 [Pantherophis guttatus]
MAAAAATRCPPRVRIGRLASVPERSAEGREEEEEEEEKKGEQLKRRRRRRTRKRPGSQKRLSSEASLGGLPNLCAGGGEPLSEVPASGAPLMADGGKGGYSEHDDRVATSNRHYARRRKGRVPFRGKMYSETGSHQRSWNSSGSGPRGWPDDDDDDVLMSDAHEVLRTRYTPYGSRPHRPDRGSPSLMNATVRRNLNIGDRAPPPPPPQKGTGSRKTWFRITIPYGRKYEKNWLMNAIHETCSVPFHPVEFHCVNNRVVFYVEDTSVANALKQTSRKILSPDGYKVAILINTCNPPMTVQHELKPEDIEHLKQCMSKRYDSANQALDMKNIHTDPDLIAQNCDIVLNRRNCMLAVLQIIDDNIPELLSLNLSDNKLYRLDDMSALVQKAPNLKILNLSCNQLKTEHELDKLKGLKLDELWLDSNPLCDGFRDRSLYISAIRERFPKLLRLDGHELPPPISFDVETPTTLPPCKGSYFASEGLKMLIVRFLQQYYAIYDSGDRQGLLDAYHEGACCSLSIPFSGNHPYRTQGSEQTRNCLSEYFKNSRNVKRLKDPSLRFRLLKHTKLNVVAFLSELPKTQHDVNSFVVDVCAQTNSLLCFSLSGIFKEVDSRSRELVRAFTRVFIAVPVGHSGLSIVNDQLFIRKANNTEIRKAFVMPAPTPSSSPVPTPSTEPMPSSSPGPTLTAEQQEMLQNFSLQSGMNLEWSQKCLMDNDWNYAKAAHAYTQLKAQQKIPEVAFIH